MKLKNKNGVDILIVTDKTDKKVDRQVQRWFSGNPNRIYVYVKTDNGTFLKCRDGRDILSEIAEEEKKNEIFIRSVDDALSIEDVVLREKELDNIFYSDIAKNTSRRLGRIISKLSRIKK